MHRDAATRHQDVRARKAAFFAQRECRAFVDQVAAGQLVAAHARIGEQRACTAFDVDPAVGAGGTGVGRDGVQLLFVLTQVLGQGLEALGAFLKVELEQIGQAHGAGVMHRVAKVECFGMGLVNRLAVDGAAQGLRALLADPLATDETLQDLGHGEMLSGKVKDRPVRINRPIGREILIGFYQATAHDNTPMGNDPYLPSLSN